MSFFRLISFFVCSEEDSQKYDKLSFQDFINHSPNMRWCPGKGCEMVIMGNDDLYGIMMLFVIIA